MRVDVEPGMRTTAAVAWEAAAKIVLLVLALYLLDRGCCSSVYCSSTGCYSSTCCCCCCCCCGRCSSTMWWSTGSHPTESLVEQDCVSSGHWLCVSHGSKAAVPRNPDVKSNEKPTINGIKSRQRMHIHLLVRDNIWAGPRIFRAGPYRARVSWALLPCDGPGRAGSRLLKKSWAGSGLAGKF